MESRLTLLLPAIAFVILFCIPRPVREAVDYPLPSPLPLTGAWAFGKSLASAGKIGENVLSGCESFVVDEKRKIGYCSAERSVIAYHFENQTTETIAVLGGRLGGLHIDDNGDVYVADFSQGFFQIDPRSRIVSLVATEADGLPFGYADDVEVAQDGTLYLTDATQVYLTKQWPTHSFDPLYPFLVDYLSAKPSGRLIKLDSKTRKATVLLQDQYFLNGIALSADESYLLLTETNALKVKRFWLKGEKKGLVEDFLTNLPGYPDSIHRGSDGTFWITIFNLRFPYLESLSPYGFLKSLILRLPASYVNRLATGVHHSLVVQVNQDGKVLRSFHDDSGAVNPITSCIEYDGKLYLSSMVQNAVSVFPLK
eukprot:GILK01007640.1.p1 GENE.GILK01007640.1~~GILK01007640.1.p1  ORF type:complete len:377 (+),score=52.95 GILK01007640.1:30-1133(+)